MKVILRLLIILLAAAGLAWLVWPRPQPVVPAGITGLNGPPGTGFKRAEGPILFAFPLDFGPHPDYQTEWWYYTGNLQTAAGQPFGFELTFFRRALLSPDQREKRPSDWATEQIIMAHFALTSVQDSRFQAFERFERGAAGLAGAVGQPLYKVWLHDWQVEQTAPDLFHLTVAEGLLSIDLSMKDLKGPVLQGDRGYSQKGPEVGNASYYLSQTRLQTRGTIRSGGQSYQVTGLSWMDHEFSSSALIQGQVGWDWFALQLDDGSELMVYTLRRSDGSLDPFSRGTLVRPDGSTRTLKRNEYAITPTSTWQSPASGAVYPAGWTIAVPGEDLTLTVTPAISNQEVRVSFTYWEGAVQVKGNRAGKAIAGSGYVELTGYAKSMAGQF